MLSEILSDYSRRFFLNSELAWHGKLMRGLTGLRSHRWLDNWRQLITRYDWYTQSYIAFLTIACFMVTLARILQ
jgi:hypothetical protein